MISSINKEGNLVQEEADRVDLKLPQRKSSKPMIFTDNLHCKTESEKTIMKLGRSSCLQTADELPSPIKKHTQIVIRKSILKEKIKDQSVKVSSKKLRVRVSVNMDTKGRKEIISGRQKSPMKNKTRQRGSLQVGRMKSQKGSPNETRMVSRDMNPPSISKSKQSPYTIEKNPSDMKEYLVFKKGSSVTRRTTLNNAQVTMGAERTPKHNMSRLHDTRDFKVRYIEPDCVRSGSKSNPETCRPSKILKNMGQLQYGLDRVIGKQSRNSLYLKERSQLVTTKKDPVSRERIPGWNDHEAIRNKERHKIISKKKTNLNRVREFEMFNNQTNNTSRLLSDSEALPRVFVMKRDPQVRNGFNNSPGRSVHANDRERIMGGNGKRRETAGSSFFTVANTGIRPSIYRNQIISVKQ